MFVCTDLLFRSGLGSSANACFTHQCLDNIKRLWKPLSRGLNTKSGLRTHICREHSGLIKRECVTVKHIPHLRTAAKHKRKLPLILACDWQCTSSKHCEWSFEGTNWINPVSVVAVALGQWRDFLGGVIGAWLRCVVGVLVSHSCVEAVNSFLNVSLNTKTDMLDLIEYGTSQSTQRNKDYQLIFLPLCI